MRGNDKRYYFFKIIKNVFGDKSEDINPDNYMRFYHVLFNSLEKKSKTTDRKIYIKVVELIGNYDIMIDADPIMLEYFETQSLTLDLLMSFTNFKRNHFFEELFEVRKYYNKIKEDFLEG